MVQPLLMPPVHPLLLQPLMEEPRMTQPQKKVPRLMQLSMMLQRILQVHAGPIIPTGSFQTEPTN